MPYKITAIWWLCEIRLKIKILSLSICFGYQLDMIDNDKKIDWFDLTAAVLMTHLCVMLCLHKPSVELSNYHFLLDSIKYFMALKVHEPNTDKKSINGHIPFSRQLKNIINKELGTTW